MSFFTSSVRTSSAVLTIFDSAADGEPVLLLHGGPGCPDYLQPVAELLGSFRTIRFDQRGVGASTTLNGSYAVGDYVGDVEALRSHLGIDRWHVFGHSWGGLLAQLYAGAHGDRVLSLFLCNSALGVGADWRRNQREIARHNLRTQGPVGAVALVSAYFAARLPGALGQRAAEHQFARAWRGYFPDARSAPAPDPDWLRGVNARAARLTEVAVLADDAGSLCGDDPSRPTTVVYGDKDIFGSGADVVGQRFPSAAQRTVRNCGHVPWLQRPEEFGRLVTEFYDAQGTVP
jgi:proline iminopeptidase